MVDGLFAKATVIVSVLGAAERRTAVEKPTKLVKKREKRQIDRQIVAMTS